MKKTMVVVCCALLALCGCEKKQEPKKQRAKVNRAASQLPPGGLAVKDVPQFVVLTFDDNSYSGLLANDGAGGGMKWVLDTLLPLKNPAGSGQEATFDGAAVRGTFFMVGEYLDRKNRMTTPWLRKEVRRAIAEGNEIANHSYTHSGHLKTSKDPQFWDREINGLTELLARPDIEMLLLNDFFHTGGLHYPQEKVAGFRVPYLAYSQSQFDALARNGYRYDSSIAEGMQPDQNEANQVWPYTLDAGSPGDADVAARKNRKPLRGAAGIWELPVYKMTAPPDEKCVAYGVAPGMRARVKKTLSWLSLVNGKLGGEDYSMMVIEKLSRQEIEAVWKYTLDRKYAGNRAPMVMLLHGDITAPSYGGDPVNIRDYRDRQKAVKDFIVYALSKPDVRIVPAKDVLDWLENPVPLKHKKELQTKNEKI